MKTFVIIIFILALVAVREAYKYGYEKGVYKAKYSNED